MKNQVEICPLRLAMDIIGGKWRLSIICLLKDGRPMRYNQIKRGVPGITNVMLFPISEASGGIWDSASGTIQ